MRYWLAVGEKMFGGFKGVDALDVPCGQGGVVETEVVYGAIESWTTSSAGLAEIILISAISTDIS